MAKEDEKKPTAAEKGKAKAVNGDAEKKEDTKADGKDKKVETTGGTSRLRNRCNGSYVGRILMAKQRNSAKRTSS